MTQFAELRYLFRQARNQNMDEITALAGWGNFFVILGSSAGALIGLQFVVVALLADVTTDTASQQQQQASSAFATPTVMHFCVVLLLSAALSAPWHNVQGPTTVVGLIGFCGIVYSLDVTRRLRLQNAYRPVFEDWLFHSFLPVAAYVLMAASAYEARIHAHGSIFGVGAAALLLLFCGMHNAWDTASYHVFVARNRRRNEVE